MLASVCFVLPAPSPAPDTMSPLFGHPLASREYLPKGYTPPGANPESLLERYRAKQAVLWWKHEGNLKTKFVLPGPGSHQFGFESKAAETN